MPRSPFAGKGKSSPSGHELGGNDTDGEEKPYGVRSGVASATEELKVSINMGGKKFGGTTVCLPLPRPLRAKKAGFIWAYLHMALLFMLFLDLMKPKQAKTPCGGVVT